MECNKQSRIMYILQATFEYLISILVAGSYLASITKSLGMSDSLTGILSSVISLGCLFQLLSLTFRVKRVKTFVIMLSFINQLLFLLLYVVPIVKIPAEYKTVIFAISIFAAYFLYNLAHPNKINWLMSFVDDHHRGSFTADKEMISLISGIVFSYVMGNVIDRFNEQGRTETAFAVSALVILVLTVLHTVALLFAGDQLQTTHRKVNLVDNIKGLAGNKTILKITFVFILYYILNYASVPFYGAYCINDLGFGLKTVSVITIFGNGARILVSRFWGKYADRKSFAYMYEKSLIVLLLSFACMVFATPANGRVMYSLYVIIHGVAMGGLNSALINLIYDYVDVEKRADSLAITQAFAGLTGFLTTLAVSPFVAYVQGNDNTLFGLHIYAQQALSLLSLVLTMVTIFYVRLVVMKINKG